MPRGLAFLLQCSLAERRSIPTAGARPGQVVLHEVFLGLAEHGQFGSRELSAGTGWCDLGHWRAHGLRGSHLGPRHFTSRTSGRTGLALGSSTTAGASGTATGRDGDTCESGTPRAPTPPRLCRALLPHSRVTEPPPAPPPSSAATLTLAAKDMATAPPQWWIRPKVATGRHSVLDALRPRGGASAPRAVPRMIVLQVRGRS